MRVFILCTGRSGSVTWYNACKHITNYTSGHESLAKRVVGRLDFADQHIEADNRLTWFLGDMDTRFGQDAYYVHLVRDRDLTVKSFMNRWSTRGNIIAAFAEGILKTPPEKMNTVQKMETCELYYDTVNANICQFLKDKPKKMTVELERIDEGFADFWKEIGAKGDYEKAISEIAVRHNSSSELRSGFLYKLKLSLLALFKAN